MSPRLMSSTIVELQQTQYIDRVIDDSSCAWKMATCTGTVVTRGLCVLEARDVKTELVLWTKQQQ